MTHKNSTLSILVIGEGGTVLPKQFQNPVSGTSTLHQPCQELSKTCLNHVQHISETSPNHLQTYANNVQNMSDTCPKHANTFPEHVHDMSKTCPTRFQNMFKTCAEHVKQKGSMHVQTSPAHVQDLPNSCLSHVQYISNRRPTHVQRLSNTCRGHVQAYKHMSKATTVPTNSYLDILLRYGYLWNNSWNITNGR